MIIAYTYLPTTPHHEHGSVRPHKMVIELGANVNDNAMQKNLMESHMSMNNLKPGYSFLIIIPRQTAPGYSKRI